MHLATIALLQVLELPKNAIFLNSTQPLYDPDFWQCRDVPNFSKAELEAKCPRITAELNVCCARWNDCVSIGEGRCTEQLYDCSKIVLTASNPQNFDQCSDYPLAALNHYDTHRKDLKTANLFMKEDELVSQIYQKCPTKQRTFSTCIYNYKQGRYFSSAIHSLDDVDNVLKQFDLRMCMEMHLTEDGEEHCQNTVESFLGKLNGLLKHTSVIANITSGQQWKCGANQFDTYITQVIVGQECLWLKEAFNTCCKVNSRCLKSGLEAEECSMKWDSCNQGVITNGDGTIAQECLPFTTWVKHEQALEQRPSSKSFSPSSIGLYLCIGATLVVLLFVILAAYCTVVCYRNAQLQNYRRYVMREEERKCAVYEAPDL